MLPQLVLSAYPLPVKSIQLGALISNLRSPHQDAITGDLGPVDLNDEGAVAPCPCEEISKEMNRARKTEVSAVLLRLLTLNLTGSGNTSSSLVADKSMRYNLLNPESRFNDLIKQEAVRKWLEVQVEEDTTVYMITGLQTALNQRMVQKVTQQVSYTQQSSTDTLENESTTVVPHIGVRGSHTSGESSGDTFFTPGERVFALSYRKVNVRSVDEQRYRLDKNNCWKAIGDNRGESDESEAEILEAVLEDGDAEYSGRSEVITLGDVEIEYHLL